MVSAFGSSSLLTSSSDAPVMWNTAFLKRYTLPDDPVAVSPMPSVPVPTCIGPWLHATSQPIATRNPQSDTARRLCHAISASVLV